MVAAGVICAETDERARFLAGSSALSFLRLRQGRPGRVPTPEEAAAYPTPTWSRPSSRTARRPSTSAPRTRCSGLTELLKRTEVDELMLTTQTYEPGRPPPLLRAGGRGGIRQLTRAPRVVLFPFIRTGPW